MEEWKTEIVKFDKDQIEADRQYERYTIPVGVQFEEYPTRIDRVAVNCWTYHQWITRYKSECSPVRVIYRSQSIGVVKVEVAGANPRGGRV
jgi:hypothetical protein